VTLGLTYNFGNAWSKNKKMIWMGIVPKCRGSREGTSCVQDIKRLGSNNEAVSMTST